MFTVQTQHKFEISPPSKLQRIAFPSALQFGGIFDGYREVPKQPFEECYAALRNRNCPEDVATYLAGQGYSSTSRYITLYKDDEPIYSDTPIDRIVLHAPVSKIELRVLDWLLEQPEVDPFENIGSRRSTLGHVLTHSPIEIKRRFLEHKLFDPVKITAEEKYGVLFELFYSSKQDPAATNELAKYFEEKGLISESEVAFFKKHLPNIRKELTQNDPSDHALQDQAGHLLFYYDKNYIAHIAWDAESAWGKRGVNSHPNEAELCLFLRHPQNLGRKGDAPGKIAEALSNLNNYHDKRAFIYREMTDVTLKALADIGLLTYAFRNWRFDTQGGTESLFSKFGFTPINERNSNKFGNGYRYKPDGMFSSFAYKPLDHKSEFEFRRGYLLVTNPAHGTLVIRNSSQVFGRDLMKHVAYYCDGSFPIEKMSSIDPDKDKKHFSPVFSADLYSPSVSKYESNLTFLTSELLNLKANYQDWKLRTVKERAFGETPHGRDFIGCSASEGLPHIVQYLKGLAAQHKTLPAIAFINPDYPIFDGYIPNEKKISLAEHPEVIDEMSDSIKGIWHEDSLWAEFLQEGINSELELVLLGKESQR